MPASNDGPSARRGEAARQLFGKALRRGAQRLDAAQGRLSGGPPVTGPQPGQRPRRRPAGPGQRPAPIRRPPTERRPEDGGPAVGEARELFFRTLERSGDFGSAAAATTRAHLARGASARARSFAQVLQQQGGATRQTGDICMAMTAVVGELPRTAWRLFRHADLAEVLRLAAAEYLRTAFGADVAQATDALTGLLNGKYPTEADAASWFDIAATSFLAGRDDLSRAALDRATTALRDLDDVPARNRLRTDVEWLRRWHGTSSGPVATSELPAIGVMHFQSPDRNASSRNLGEYLESLASLAQLARQADVRAEGPLGGVVDELRSRITGAAAPAAATVQLVDVGRDASAWAAVPDGTWLIYTGVLPQSLFGVRRDLPLDPRLRPVFLSVHVDSARALPPAAIEYLRVHAPIGCRDWSTVLLLQAAGVPAFFAGSVTTTLGELGGGAASGPVTVDAGGTDATDLSQDSDAVRERDLAANLRAALEHVDTLAGASRVRTTRLQSYLAARSAGTAADFRPDNRAQRRLWGLLDLDDGALETMRRGITAKLAAVYGAILAGKPEDEVCAVWREVCAADVERADAFRTNVAPMPAPAIDVPAACATIRRASVTVERTVAAGDGGGESGAEEINVELSLDGNYKHQLEVVLDSIVTNTARPVRAFVLCREHTQDDYDRMAALFPEVSFVWLPTDGVDYGPISGLLGYTTVATMDRLLLPDLLPEVSRIVHHDLDALCLVDLAGLHDVELGGKPLAGRMSPQQSHASGFASLMRRSERFPRNPERGHEYLLRTHTRHRFDYDILNAGIMTLDLDAMRADDFCRNFLPYVERFGLNDQAVLNVYAGANRVEVDPGWNWRPWLETVSEPKIAHWAGEFKPWKDTWVVGRDLWRAGEARVRERYARAGTSAAS